MSREEILFVNAAFYRAFADGDAEAMTRVWADTLPVACLHPGWEPLHGRDRVLASWAAILEAPPPVACRDPRVYVYGDAAFVLCWEEVGREVLIATNVFARENGQWRMVHHQSGPTRGEPPAEEAPPTIN